MLKQTTSRAALPATLTIPVGEVVRQWRQVRDLSVTELAQRAGLTKGYISQVEHGKIQQPSQEKLVQLAYALEIDVWDLIARRQPGSPDPAQRVENDGPGAAVPGVERSAPVTLAAPPLPRKYSIGHHINRLLEEADLSEEQEELVRRYLERLVRDFLEVVKAVQRPQQEQ